MSTTNSQVVDAVSESASATVEQAASVSMADTYVAAASSTAIIIQNAASAQRGSQLVAQATVAKTCALIVQKGTSS